MKLLIVGSSGFVAQELIRQSLRRSDITSVIALGRRSVTAPTDVDADADTSKLKSVVIQDYAEWPHQIKEQIAGIDACIWTVAITPSKAKKISFEEVRKVCHDYTIIGLKAIYEARGDTAPGKPLRFLYMSGSAAERDQSKTPWFFAPYSLLRGETESEVLAFAKEHPEQVEACVAKPGLILAPGEILKSILGFFLNAFASVGSVTVTEISLAMLDQAVNGFEKEPLVNADLVRIGRQVAEKKASI